MCGIGGTTEGEAHPQAINKQLSHRGPDMFGVHTAKQLTLCHRRLSILDLSENGKQPMQYKQYSITFNGEIYNFEELKKTHLKGAKLVSGSDTEVLLHLYDKYKEKCLPLLRGMWAFAIHDTQKNTVFLTVDRFGKKPIYYKLQTKTKVAFSFASEGKALATDTEVIDKQALDLYLDYGYIPAPHTIWQGIKKLQPATSMLVDLNTGKQLTKKYWSAPTTQTNISYEHAITQLRALMKQSVDYRFVSDVPVGCFLSGGVDSSIVSALGQQRKALQGEELHTFSIGFDNERYDESAYAKEVAAHLGTKHHEERVKTKQLKEVFHKLPEIYSEPFADSSALPTYLVSKVARKKVTVSLSGDGADELFGGYRTYNHQKRLRLINKTPAKFLLPKRLQGDAQASYNGLLGSEHDHSVFGDAFTKGKNWVTQLSRADIQHYLPYDILVKVDRASMQHALEVRNPFLDHSVAEFALSLPAHYKIQEPIPYLAYRNKVILKDAYRDLLPPVVFHRKKMGFSIPQQELLGALGERTIDWPSLGIKKSPTKATTYKEYVLSEWLDTFIKQQK